MQGGSNQRKPGGHNARNPALRHRPLVIVAVAAFNEPSLEVLLDAAIEHAFARSARPIPRSGALPGPALDPHPCPRCPALRRWGSGWAAPCAGRHWPEGLGRTAEVSCVSARRQRGIAGRLVNGRLPENSAATPTVRRYATLRQVKRLQEQRLLGKSAPEDGRLIMLRSCASPRARRTRQATRSARIWASPLVSEWRLDSCQES